MTSQPHLLFVDDERLMHNVISRLFTRHGMKVTSCFSATQAMDELKQTAFDLVVTDFMMPEIDGLELLAHIRQEYSHLKVVMITGHSTVQHAVRTMRSGAVDYIPKPFSTTELLERVRSCLQEAEAPVAQAAPRSKPSHGKKSGIIEYVGEHPSILQLKKMLPLVSMNKAPIFIQGESGTGKEVLARLIHQMSDRGDGPFIALNCANLPHELVESHLFGHRKGAFTGAIDDMTGAFEQADGGTLLLDEITEIDLNVQAKLLRVLQEQEIQKVGSTETKKIDVRIIATSNRNLSEAMAQRYFREDLYHRLSVFPLNVPPLRNRRSDIPLLANHFANKYSELYGLPEKSITPDLMSYFQAHSWSGNVRNLENLVQRGVLLSADRDVIEIHDVLHDFFSDAQPADIADKAVPAQIQTIADMEHYMIMQALAESNNNQQIASKRLGISSRTIRNKLRKYREEGLSAP
ncbi:MAG: sigma-54-dependent transcriptional regulator [Rhodothermales bacterium]